jgi:hypothetical protein
MSPLSSLRISAFLSGSAGLCPETTHVSEWMINYNLPQRLPRIYESHQHELVDRSFKLEEAAIEESTN